MANRMYNQFQGSLEKGVVELMAEVRFTAGAPVLVRGKGFSGVGVLGAGAFNITMQDGYVALLGATFAWTATSSNALVTAPFVQIRPTSDVTAAAGGYVNFTCLNTSGVATNPAVDEKLFIKLTLSNSTAL